MYPIKNPLLYDLDYCTLSGVRVLLRPSLALGGGGLATNAAGPSGGSFM